MKTLLVRATEHVKKYKFKCDISELLSVLEWKQKEKALCHVTG